MKGCATAGLVAATLPAAAQDWVSDPTWSPGVSVYERLPAPLEPQGHEVGEFLVFPSVDVTALYDNNIFATSSDRDTDYIGLVEPSIYAETRQDGLAVEGLLSATGSLYMDNSNQDEVELEARVQGRQRVSESGELNAGAAFLRQVVDRADVEEGGGTGDPRIAYRYLAELGYGALAGPWSYGLDGTVRYNDFRGQSDKNRTNYDVVGLLGYQATPSLMPFVEPFAEIIDFEQSVDRNGFDRSARRAGARAGALYELGDLLTLEGTVGASRWEFDDARFDDEWVWSADGLAGWNVSPVTTLKLGAGRDEVNTTLAGASLKTINSVRVGIEHAFRPHLMAFADAEFSNVDFDNVGREDDDTTLAIGANYLLSRMFWVSAGYTYDQRDSNRPADYERSIVWLSLRTNF